MIAHGKEIKVFCGNANRKFAEGVCAELGINLGDSEVKSFSDGEISVSVNETVRGSRCLRRAVHLHTGQRQSDGTADYDRRVPPGVRRAGSRQ